MKTAVNWLIEQITSKPISELTDEEWFGIMGQAKAMEKGQIMDADAAGFRDGCLWSEGEEIYFKSPGHYYVETYGINND